MFFRYVIMAVLMISLIACKPVFERDYLLKNPRILGKELSRCRLNADLQLRYCRMVKETASRFIAFEHLQSSNPLQFGMQIMQVQKALQELNLTSNSKEKLEQQHKLEMLWAVIAAIGQID